MQLIIQMLTSFIVARQATVVSLNTQSVITNSRPYGGVTCVNCFLIFVIENSSYSVAAAAAAVTNNSNLKVYIISWGAERNISLRNRSAILVCVYSISILPRLFYTCFSSSELRIYSHLFNHLINKSFNKTLTK